MIDVVTESVEIPAMKSTLGDRAMWLNERLAGVVTTSDPEEIAKSYDQFHSTIPGMGGLFDLNLDDQRAHHDGATNTIYTGADRPSFIQLPVIPAR